VGTPCNEFGKGCNGSSWDPRVGGPVGRGAVTSSRFKHRVNPLPRMDVIVFGDFNYAMGADYRPCI
jgi:hypothetical protein